MTDVTVLGLGYMGAALAQAFGNAGCEVTVWNRSPVRHDAVLGANIRAAPTVAEAVRESPAVVICIDNPEAVTDLLAPKQVAQLLRGRTVIQLSTCLPRQAVAAERWLAGLGAAYLDGAILCGPASIGTPEGLIVVSGSGATYQSVVGLLSHLGGKVRHVGEDAGAAEALDLAWLSTRFGRFMGMIHAANLCRSQNVDLGEFLALLPDDVQVQHHVGAIRDDAYKHPSASLSVWQASLGLLQQQAADAGINSEFPDLVAAFFDRAVDAGYGDEHVMALYKVMRDSGSA